MRQRLDSELVTRGLVGTRSQAASYIKLGRVRVDGQIVSKPSLPVSDAQKIKIEGSVYVSRAAHKLASVSQRLKLNFADKIVLDVGSSTGGFTQFALEQGAKKVVAVDVGSKQLHPSLRGNDKIELHEKTDIRKLDRALKDIDMAVIDVSFISLRQILPSLGEKLPSGAKVVAMFKPQFEGREAQKHKGVIKNDRMRRDIIKDFEAWLKPYFVILDKADSVVSGSKGNRERFYLLKYVAKSN